MMTKNRKRVLELEVRLNDALQACNYYRKKYKQLKEENALLKRRLMQPLFSAMETATGGDGDVSQNQQL